jgi:glycosyltransferase involved in cell wall biosynthesis
MTRENGPGKPLRILHLDCTMGRGGQEKDHLNEAVEFRRRGHQYWIGARPGTRLLSWSEKEGIGIPFSMRSNFDLPSFLAIRRFIVLNQVNVLVTTSYIDSVLGWFAALSLGSSRPPVFRQRHLLNPPNHILPYRHFCDYLVAVSDIARFGFIERGIPFWKTISLPRGIPEPVEHPCGNPSDPFPDLGEKGRMILQIGTFQRDKGQLSLMEGLLPFLLENPSLHLVLLGEGPLKDNIERKRDSERFRAVRSRIHLPGWTDPVPFYRRAAVTVISSFREAFPLVALESLPLGVPVVAFRQGGVPEVFDWAGWGELVDPWNVEELSRTAVKWATRPELSCPKIDTIRKVFVERFSIESSVDRTERVYRWSIEKVCRGDGENPYALSGGAADPFFGFPGRGGL